MFSKGQDKKSNTPIKSTKYMICFRGSDHDHDALTQGIDPHGGKIGPIEYDGTIGTETAIPISPSPPTLAAAVSAQLPGCSPAGTSPTR